MAPLQNNYVVTSYESPKTFFKRLLFFLPLASLVCGVMLHHWAFYVLAAVLLVVLVLVVLRKDRCPHCGKLIWGKKKEYCPHCDERLDAKCEK